MITKQELMDFSLELSLAPNIVEKDYVLGWILAGIANAKELFQNWVFKGGTCLKKCYFETYRFSEDLDFTLTDKEQLNEEFLTKNFIQISQWVYEQAGIEIPPSTVRFELYVVTWDRVNTLAFRRTLQYALRILRVRLGGEEWSIGKARIAYMI